MSYDSWLEAPYRQRADEGAAYEAWCEKNDKDPDDDLWDEFVDAMEQAREDYLVEKAEAEREERMLGWG